MIRLRASLAILLVTVLVMTGHSMAIARGMPTASGYMELCTGTGPVMVPMDAEGNPTGPAHICPEFSLSLLDAVAPVPALAVPVESRGRRIGAAKDVIFRVIRPVDASARAPPMFG